MCPIVKLSDNMPTHVHSLIYGGPGVGKTLWAATSQSLRTLVLDADQGVTTLLTWKGDPYMPAVRRDLIHVWPVENKGDFMSGLEHIVKNYRNYDLVVVDTVTELQRIALQEITESRKMLIPDQQSWGQALLLMENITRQFRKLPLHVIFLAHEIAENDENTGLVAYRPSFQGAYAREYAKHFDMIGRYGLANQQVKDPATNQISIQTIRFIQCQRDAIAHAKDRFNILEKYETPNVDMMLAKMLSAIRASNS